MKFIPPFGFLLAAILFFTSAGCHFGPPQLTGYTSHGGQVWRQFRDGEITKEEYEMKMKLLKDLQEQEEKWREFAIDNTAKMSESDWEEMRAYRKRVDKRMEEIADWIPSKDKKVSQSGLLEGDPFFHDPFGQNASGLQTAALGRDIHSEEGYAQLEDAHAGHH